MVQLHRMNLNPARLATSETCSVIRSNPWDERGSFASSCLLKGLVLGLVLGLVIRYILGACWISVFPPWYLIVLAELPLSLYCDVPSLRALAASLSEVQLQRGNIQQHGLIPI